MMLKFASENAISRAAIPPPKQIPPLLRNGDGKDEDGTPFLSAAAAINNCFCFLAMESDGE